MRFRRGDRVFNARTGESATVFADVPIGATKMELEFDGEVEPVTIADWERS
jgi:hypothetical protein